MANDSSPSDSHIIRAWDAYIAQIEQVPLEDAAGRQAASTIRQYPPGIPDIIPGMTYSKALIERLEKAHIAGAKIIGIDMDHDRKVDVVVTPSQTEPTSQFQTETILAKDVTEKLLIEISDFFKAGFSASPYYHFAFHQDDPFTALPPNLDFQAWAKSITLDEGPIRSERQNQLLHTAEKTAKPFYAITELDEISLPSKFHRWTDTEICRQQIKNRLQDPGYVTLIRDVASHALMGLLHARVARIDRLFQTEEWENPFLFSQYQDPNLCDDPNRFFQKIHTHFSLHPEDIVLTISAQLLHPNAKGGAVFYDMMRSVGFAVSPAHARLPMLCEIPPEGTAHELNAACATRLIYGIIKNDHPLIFSDKTSDALFPFISQKSHWNSVLKSAVKAKIEYEKHHYIRRVTDNPHVVVKPNGEMGLAVFATEDIQAGARIAIFQGETYEAEYALDLPSIMRDHAIQIGPTHYVFGDKGLAHCLCHSCDPNCGIRNYTEIFAVNNISAGDQLTWDYRCSENSNWVLEKCLCGASRCTGRVENFDSLPSEMKYDYLARNMVSEWISNATGL